jgi:hypothetical protein
MWFQGSIGARPQAASRNAGPFHAFHMGNFLAKEISKMDQRDQELLDKPLRGLNPSPGHDGVMILMVVAVFFAGMSLGSILSAYKSEPMQLASNDATPAISFLNGVPPTTRR